MSKQKTVITYYDYEQKNKKSECQFDSEGLRHGECVLYFETGEVSRRCSYKEGLLHGLYVEYYTNGSIKKQGSYKNGKKHGLWKEWFENGVLASYGDYVNGEWSGTWKTFDDEGNIASQATYHKGLVNGLYQEYDAEGNITLSAQLDMGIPNGHHIEQTENTKTIRMIDNGKEQSRQTFDAGVLYSSKINTETAALQKRVKELESFIQRQSWWGR